MRHIYEIKPNTYHKAFLLGAIVAALISGFAIEMQDRNLFNLYKKPEDTTQDSIYNITVTVLLTGVISYIGFWIARFLFGYGKSALVM